MAVAAPKQMRACAATGAPMQLQYRQKIPTGPRMWAKPCNAMRKKRRLSGSILHLRYRASGRSHLLGRVSVSQFLEEGRRSFLAKNLAICRPIAIMAEVLQCHVFARSDIAMGGPHGGAPRSPIAGGLHGGGAPHFAMGGPHGGAGPHGTPLRLGTRRVRKESRTRGSTKH